MDGIQVELREAEAINRLYKGDWTGLEALVELHQQRVLRTAYLILGDGDDAADVVQDAFLRALDKIHQFDRGRPFAPWFLRIVVNLSLKQVKKTKREVHQDASPIQDFRELIDNGPSPVTISEQLELRRQVRQALENLPARQRAALVMRYYLEMGEKEISQALDGPLGTVKWRLHQARKMLAGHLAGEGEPR